MTSLLNGFSGRIGEPEGQSRLMNPSRIEDAVNFVEANQESITNIIINGGGGGTSVGARVGGDGTTFASSGITSVTRMSEGWYRVVPTTTAATGSNGKAQMWVNVTCATPSGDGSDGVTPYLAYDSFSAILTDQDIDDRFEYNDGFLILWGLNTDDLWHHEIADWAGTPEQNDTSGAVYSAMPGCITYEGDYVWISRAASSADIAVYNIATDTMTSFGAGPLSDNRRCVASKQVGGTLRLWMSDGGTFSRYTPSIAGPTLGSADFNYSGVDWNQAGDFRWDQNGYLWFLAPASFVQHSPTSNAVYEHDYPAETPNGVTLSATAGGGPLAFDPLRNRWYCVLSSTSEKHLYQYSGWVNGVEHSGTWQWLADLEDSDPALYFDSASDVLFVSCGTRVQRFIGDPKVLLDTVIVPGDIASHTIRGVGAYYNANYGYIATRISTTYYLVRLSYNGSGIGVGAGGALVSSVIKPLYNVVNASTVDVYTFGFDNPAIRRDCEFSIDIKYP